MRIIAHRSGPGKYPEQTVKSALYALQNGADMAEIDLRFSADGRLAVSHDENISRLFGIDRRIGTLTAAEYTSLPRKDCSGYSGHIFEDYTDAGVSPLLLHIKESTARLPALLEMVNGITGFSNITLGVSTPGDVKTVKDYNSGIPVLAFMRDRDMTDGCIEEGADYIRLWQGWVSEDLIRKIHCARREVWIMTGGCCGFDVGETSDDFLLKAIGMGADGILINDIMQLKNLL